MPTDNAHSQRIQEVRDHWDARYRESEAVWSGNVNPSLEQALEKARMKPAPAESLRALDIGCGEGGDALWLATLGYTVTGLDIAPTAIDRARTRATKEGLTNTTFVASDAESWLASQNAADTTFDLITVSFFHTNLAVDRDTVLTAARALLAPGGVFLTVSHAHMPPWAREHFTAEEWEARTRALPTVQSEPHVLAGTGSDTLFAEVWDRPVVSPDGQDAVLEDLVVAVRARA